MHNKYNKFIQQSMLLFMKERLESKAQIYAIYWKQENVLTMVWKIIQEILKENLDFFEFD